MLHKLPAERYSTILPMLHDAAFAYHIHGMLAGNSPARIWTDHEEEPGSAYIWDGARCHYLVGHASRPGFHRSLARLIEQDIAPKALANGLSWHKVYCSSPAWHAHVDTLFGGHHHLAHRAILVLGELAMPGRSAHLPASVLVRRIDRDLLSNIALANRDSVLEEIESCWPSAEHFLERGFGFCLLAGDEIVSWCTAEYVSPGGCGCGVETVERYQKRGYATLVAGALAEHCHARHILLRWDAFAANLPSLAVARKVGFIKRQEYDILVGDFAPSLAS